MPLPHDDFTFSMSIVSYNRSRLVNSGSRTTVDDNLHAKLMYYLNCVACCVEGAGDLIPLKYRDYQNYSELTPEDRLQVLWWAKRLHPSLLTLLGIFQADHTLCQEDPNKFYEQTGGQAFGTTALILRETDCRIIKIMAYKASWMRLYYEEPMRQVDQWLDNPTPPQVVVQEIHQHITNNYYSTTTERLCSVQ